MASNLAVDTTSCGYLRQVNTPFDVIRRTTRHVSAGCIRRATIHTGIESGVGISPKIGVVEEIEEVETELEPQFLSPQAPILIDRKVGVDVAGSAAVATRLGSRWDSSDGVANQGQRSRIENLWTANSRARNSGYEWPIRRSGAGQGIESGTGKVRDGACKQGGRST